MGKIWKSSIMTVTCITPDNSQKPRDVTDRLQRVRAFWHKHFCVSGHLVFVAHSVVLHGEAPECLCLPLTLTFAHAGFITIHTHRHWGHIHLVTWKGFQSWKKIPNHQMLLGLINWVNWHDYFKRSEQCGATPGHSVAQKLFIETDAGGHREPRPPSTPLWFSFF